MKIIKCDRCGKDIPYVPPYMNAAQQGVIPPKIMLTLWNYSTQTLNEVDLCDDCRKSVYEYIFACV